MLDAVMFGHKNFQPVIDLIISLAEMAAKEPRDLPPPAYDKKALQAKLKALDRRRCHRRLQRNRQADALRQA